MERVRGIEPPYQAWEACVLPLNYTRRPPDCSDRVLVGTKSAIDFPAVVAEATTLRLQ